MSTRKVPSAHEKFLHDLPARKHEVLLEQHSPVFQGLRMMAIQPSFERSMLRPQALYAARILNRCIHLQSIPNYAMIAEQSDSICLTIRGNFVDIKGIIRGTKIAGFFQNRDPGKPCLINLQNEALKEQMVILEGKTILRIVINTIMSIFRMRIAIVTIRGLVDILLSSSE